MNGAYDPETYDLANAASFHGDIEWYCARARACEGPVLELGAGTGRVTLALARAGHSVHALDAHTGMLQALRRKAEALPLEVQTRITVVEGDMRDFQLVRVFPLVIVPFRAFLHNVTTEDQLACLRCARAHLTPGGQLAFNVFHPSLQYMAQHAGPFSGTWRWTGSYGRPGGGRVLCSEANRYDTVRQRVHSSHRFEHFDANGMLTRTFVHHLDLAYLYPQDIRLLLERSGFDTVEIAGDFSGRPFEHDTDELVVTARAVSTTT